MPVCSAVVKSTGNPCTKQSKPGLTVCGTHAPRAPRPPPPPLADNERCTRIKSNWNGHPDTREEYRCDKKRFEGHGECRTHYNMTREREIRKETRERRWHVETTFSMHLWQFQRELPDHMPWMERAQIRRMMVERIVEIAGNRLAVEEDVWMAMDEYRILNPPAPESEASRLERIARDGQNTHTREVSMQTNSNLEVLFRTEIEVKGDTLAMIRKAWSVMYAKGVDERIYADMQKWYDTETCRKQGDWLYRRTLDHLIGRIALIKENATRRELLKRLQQECAESYAMCCDGHISRLTNVMVGFDEAFQPQVPKGEILQQKMSVISQNESAEERMKLAKALMEELKISDEEAAPWLEAVA